MSSAQLDERQGDRVGLFDIELRGVGNGVSALFLPEIPGAHFLVGRSGQIVEIGGRGDHCVAVGTAQCPVFIAEPPALVLALAGLAAGAFARSKRS